MQQKDNSIKNIVRHLQDKFGVDNIVIKDHWDADNFAIGVTNKDNKNLVYISTYMKKSNECFVELESQAENENQECKNCGNFDNVNVERLETIVRNHLNLK